MPRVCSSPEDLVVHARVVLTCGIGRIAAESLPGILKGLGRKSVMIEGGSRVLSSFLRSSPRSDGSPVVDTVVVTVAPMFIGEGVGVVPKVS